MPSLIYSIVQFLFLFVSYIESCQWSPTKCGCARVAPSIHSKIVGGTAATPHSWPWIVSIRKYNSHICGGTLITPLHVVSAAHCFAPYHPSKKDFYTFAMGHHTIQETYIVLKAKRIIIHEQYDKSGWLNDDIALIELEKRVSFNNSRVGFICLPWKHMNDKGAFPPVGTPTWVIGWGTTKFHGQVSKVLQQVSIPIIKNYGCKSKVQSASKQICAGLEKGGKDSCQGDSGGPLIIDTGKGVFEFVGVVSFGTGCAFANEPGIYTRVSGYINWIQKFANLKPVINPHKNPGNALKELEEYQVDALSSSPTTTKRLFYTIIFIEIFVVNLK